MFIQILEFCTKLYKFLLNKKIYKYVINVFIKRPRCKRDLIRRNEREKIILKFCLFVCQIWICIYCSLFAKLYKFGHIQKDRIIYIFMNLISLGLKDPLIFSPSDFTRLWETTNYWQCHIYLLEETYV